MRLEQNLPLENCPHCNVDKPNIYRCSSLLTVDANGNYERFWGIYSCKRCGGVITASASQDYDIIWQIFPNSITVDEALPHKAKAYLEQAISSLNAPAGSVMLTASAVDAMLKDKNYKDGSLFARINKAAEDHLITPDMATWAHEIRLDANDQRHSNEDSQLPTIEDARRLIDFAQALGLILYTLPQRVTKGIEKAVIEK